ncbi:MAG: hypothetical protein KC486_24775 [Myxococcales bacterium]|nr:hypothetical protein [Myxococcales bacterium]
MTTEKTPKAEPPARTKVEPKADASKGRVDDTEPAAASDGDDKGSNEASQGAARIYEAL